MQNFPKLAIGNRHRRLVVVASKTASAFRPIQSIWGFGSAFRQEPFSDIDLLIVLSSGPRSLLEDAIHAKRLLKDKVPRWGIPVDILVLTVREMREGPLRDMHELQLLFRRNLNCQVPCSHSRYGYHTRMI